MAQSSLCLRVGANAHPFHKLTHREPRSAEIRSAKRSALRVSEPRDVAARGHWGSCRYCWQAVGSAWFPGHVVHAATDVAVVAWSTVPDTRSSWSDRVLGTHTLKCVMGTSPQKAPKEPAVGSLCQSHTSAAIVSSPSWLAMIMPEKRSRHAVAIPRPATLGLTC